MGSMWMMWPNERLSSYNWEDSMLRSSDINLNGSNLWMPSNFRRAILECRTHVSLSNLGFLRVMVCIPPHQLEYFLDLLALIEEGTWEIGHHVTSPVFEASVC